MTGAAFPSSLFSALSAMTVIRITFSFVYLKILIFFQNMHFLEKKYRLRYFSRGISNSPSSCSRLRSSQTPSLVVEVRRRWPSVFLLLLPTVLSIPM